MDADGLKALFEPFGFITVKRMFGGAAAYADGFCFAIEADGEVFLKTDAAFAAELRSRGFPAVHLCGEGQVETDILLDSARGRP
jgi:DNA transformation protein and related proteins